MNKIFETTLDFVPPAPEAPPTRAYDPCPEYGLRFPGGLEDLAKAQSTMRAELVEYFPAMLTSELEVFSETLPDTGPACAQMRTTRTCYFERNLPPFVRVPLKGD
jgi:hypothetical protein